MPQAAPELSIMVSSIGALAVGFERVLVISHCLLNSPIVNVCCLL
jgi:hypothetical protein